MTRFWRIVGLTLLGTFVGLAGALYARQLTDFNQFNEQYTSLVWMVIAIPLGTLVGGVLANPRRWTFSLGWVAVLYFLSVFAAARLERLVIGEDQASASKHSLYFWLIAAIQTLASVFFAWRLGRESVDENSSTPSPSH